MDGIKIITDNKKAWFDYEILEKLEAGLVLTGSEVKSLRVNGCSLKDSYVAFRGREAFLQNSHIPVYSASSYNNHEPERLRKLLLHEHEIKKIETATTQKGLTCVPLKIYFKKGRAKVELGIGRGKKKSDKRQSIKDREAKREVQMYKSKGRNMGVHAALIWLALFLVSCQSLPESSNSPATRAEDRHKVEGELEISLKADRSQLDELRKEIPDGQRKSNDELALFLSVMGQGTSAPNEVRERFNSIVQKRRQTFRAKAQRLRDDYRTDETKRREQFLAEQTKRRDDFAKRKHDQKENREFFAEQDKLRSRFFGDERDRRQAFESEITAQSKDFESYMRERVNEFNEQFREYSKKYYDKPKEKKAVTGDSGGFEQLKGMDAEPLGTGN